MLQLKPSNAVCTKFVKLFVPVFHFIAVDQYGDDNDNNCKARYADTNCNADYGCIVCIFACNIA